MITAVLFAIAMLAVGFVLRVQLKLLHWCFVPAAIVGGFCGFGCVQLFRLSDTSLVAELKSWPGTLIAVVFACMFLERKSTLTMKQSLRRAGREGIVVWIVVLGQTAVGLLCTWLLIQPFYDVPNSFGMLIETGFAGGHGTATAMGSVFDSPGVALANGLDLGLFMATVGLVLSVLSGVVYVNIAIRRGWVQQSQGIELIAGLENRSSNTSSAVAKVRSEVLDPIVFQILFVGLAFGGGWTMREGVSWLAQQADLNTLQVEENEGDSSVLANTNAESNLENAPEAAASGTGNEASTAGPAEVERVLKAKTSIAGTIGDFPLFIYTLFGGLVVRRTLRVFRCEDLIDNLSIQRINGVAMEFLVVAAIASLDVQAVQASAAPLLILVLAAFFWTGFCLLFVARRLLPKPYWFQLGIINYGMSTGTTATGFTLLKIVDKDLDSGAAEDYALAAPLSSPFVGGGMLTIALPLFVLERVHIAVPALICSSIVLGLYFVGRKLNDA